MDFLVNNKFEWMKFRHVYLTASGIAIVLSIVSIFMFGLNFGIDFAGGTEVQIKFREAPPIDEIRDRLKKVGLEESSIQQFGDASENEVLIRVPELEEEGEIDDVSKLIISVLRDEKSMSLLDDGKVDLNIIGRVELKQMFKKELAGSEDKGDPEEIANRIIDYRKMHGGLISDFSEIKAGASLTEMELQILEKATFFGHFSIRQIERVGPKVGEKLKSQSMLAISFSVVFILGYIWFRFQFQFGIGAIAALVHDVIITLGVLSLFQTKFTLTIIAALLTLVGYSLNDTIVIFDRIRENLKSYRGKSMNATIDKSINESLSRTALTSLTTLLVVACLYFFGGEVINGFAFTLLIGIIVGTYSSVAIASPVLLAWKALMAYRKG